MKDVQCYELFGGIAPKNHAFSFFISSGKIHELKDLLKTFVKGLLIKFMTFFFISMLNS